jgi:hypothetical protein
LSAATLVVVAHGSSVGAGLFELGRGLADWLGTVWLGTVCEGFVVVGLGDA